MLESMPVAELLSLIAAFGVVIHFVMSVKGMFSGPVKELWKYNKAQEERIVTLEAELSLMSQKVEALPGDKALHELQLSLSRLNGEIKTLCQTVRGQREIMDRIERSVNIHNGHLLGQKG